MKIRLSISLLMMSILAGVSIWHMHSRPETPTIESEPAVPPVAEINVVSPEPIIPPPLAIPQPQPVVTKKQVALPAQPNKPTAAQLKRQRESKYWDMHARNLNKLFSQLDQEKNPAKRKLLIQNISRYMQIDTLSVLDWAMSLTDPEERHSAMELINKNALTGVGARIEMDKTGLPKIRETTVLSALEESGQVEPGDYISGMIKEDGTVVQFKGMSMQQIVNYLRGKPGTKPLLLMERMSENGALYAYDVPVQRSLIVVQRPMN